MKHLIYRSLYPLFKFYWFVLRPKTSGVKCVIQGGQNILMIRNTYGHALWTFPGGGIESGETVGQAVTREAMEEVGIELSDLRKIGEFTTTAEYKRDTVTVFAGKSDDDQFKIDEKEILEASWFSPDNLPEISEYAKKVIDLWLKERNILKS